MKKLTAGLAFALLATGIIATRLWLELRDINGRYAALQARVGELEQRPAAPLPLAPTPAANSNEPRTASAALKPAADQNAARAARATVDALRESMENPEGRDLRRAQRQRMYPLQYPDLAKALHLSPEETEKFFEQLASNEEDELDAVRKMTSAGPAGMRDGQAQLQQTRQADEAKLTAMLGGKYPEWQEYKQTLPVHQQVSQLQTMLGSGANALSDAQAKPLMAAMTAEQLRINQEPRPAPATTGSNMQDYMQQQLDRTDERNRRMLDIAAANLTAPQLDSYKRMLDQQQRTTRALLGTVREAAARSQDANAAPAAQ